MTTEEKGVREGEGSHPQSVDSLPRRSPRDGESPQLGESRGVPHDAKSPEMGPRVTGSPQTPLKKTPLKKTPLKKTPLKKTKKNSSKKILLKKILKKNPKKNHIKYVIVLLATDI